MDYAVCITAKYGRKTVFSFVRAVSFNSSFQDIFKERLETARKGDDFPKEDRDTEFILGSVRVSAGPNGPWHTVDAQENVGVLHDLGQHLLYWNLL